MHLQIHRNPVATTMRDGAGGAGVRQRLGRRLWGGGSALAAVRVRGRPCLAGLARPGPSPLSPASAVLLLPSQELFLKFEQQQQQKVFKVIYSDFRQPRSLEIPVCHGSRSPPQPQAEVSPWESRAAPWGRLIPGGLLLRTPTSLSAGGGARPCSRPQKRGWKGVRGPHTGAGGRWSCLPRSPASPRCRKTKQELGLSFLIAVCTPQDRGEDSAGSPSQAGARPS